MVSVMVVAMANRTGCYASQWRRRARDELSVFVSEQVVKFLFNLTFVLNSK